MEETEYSPGFGRKVDLPAESRIFYFYLNINLFDYFGEAGREKGVGDRV